MEYPNWFEYTAKANFELALKDLAGKPNLKFLQIGAFTGDASVWLLDNILTGDGCTLTDVDTWLGSDEPAHKAMDFSDVEKVYDDKVTGRTIKHKMTTIDFLTSPLARNDYDFIYVDADHTAASALIDGELAFRLLKSGGILAFDDYEWGLGLPASLTPKLGISLFTERHASEIELITLNSQLWLLKK